MYRLFKSEYIFLFLTDKPTTIFYGPKDNKCPLIVFPHGGPHASSLDSFMTDAVFFVQIGNEQVLISFFFRWFCS